MMHRVAMPGYAHALKTTQHQTGEILKESIIIGCDIAGVKV